MVDDILKEWQKLEADLRDFGAKDQADAVAQCAAKLAERNREWMLEELTYDEAAEYSGLAAGTIGNKVRAGKIENVGRKNAPRVRRGDLPAKPHGFPEQENIEDIDAIAEKLIARRTGAA